ncbi:prolyl 4-hydroxylase subunit alpha-2-like [Planococcus citri]|uniref:prolyl 4-hydroxylase subunit alpha-2-like n=1 Tax=Planococcus citri TaxID=170843 RepID=UPI0031F78DE3
MALHSKQIYYFVLLMSSIQLSKLHNPDIEDFLQMEANMISKTQDYLMQEQKRLDELQIHLQDWKKWRSYTIDQESEYIAIPQNLFHLFKRFTSDLRQSEKLVIKNSSNDASVLYEIKQPTEKDLERVILSFVDLQYKSDLKPEDIVNGTILDLQLDTSVSLHTCYFIGKTCSKYNNHQCATDWLETCLSLSSDHEFNLTIHELIYPSYIFLNQTRNAFDHINAYVEHEIYDSIALDAYSEIGSQLDELDDEDISTLEAQRMCRENPPNPNHSSLKCKYNRENSAFLKLAPLKEEEVSHYPKVLLYHEVLYDSEIETLKAEATKKMQVALLVGAKSNGTATRGFAYRISESAFLNNKFSSLPQLTKRMEDISDLSISSSERWQVINYAPGGFYLLHSDYLSGKVSSVKTSGNRMSTMLFYLNEVTLGGETVFPRIGVSVKPTKGLGLVWHNVHPDGSKNFLMNHSACPVIIGLKWGFTQWMRSHNQTCLRKIYEYDPKTRRGTKLNSTSKQKKENSY